MKKNIILAIALLVFGFEIPQINAQTASTSDNLIAQPVPDRTVPFDVTAPGISKTIKFGADLAWANEQNFRRAIRFMGLDQVDIVRASFQPTYPLVNDTDLTQQQIDDLNWRIYLINKYAGANIDLALNCDHPWVDDWYVGQPAHWEQLIQTTAKAFIDSGHNIVSVAVFNEPDYGWGQGTQQDMYDITNLLHNNSFFDNIRLSGGNTLDCDKALEWYNYLIPAGVNEGNTHQLAGSFDSFASFYQTVRANGDHATADEMHNIVEALVGYEYGMQTGIWWGAAERARGEMVKAFDGQRIGYSEDRANWTAAAVYRTPEGKVQAFGGTSERQAVTTSYSFISTDRVVYYDGVGPQHIFRLEMPGGTGYQTGQTNAEKVVNVSWGEDIQPAINGTYKLVNRQTGQVMEAVGTSNGSNIQLGTYSGSTSQQWQVTPVDSRIGGDFSYYSMRPMSTTTKYMDLYNYSLENGGNINLWDKGSNSNQRWYLEYNGDGWFYIRSGESSLCVVADGTGNVVQWEKAANDESQQWRLLPVDAAIEYDAPGAPADLAANGNAASIRLDWTASTASDVAGYTVFRAESAGGKYNTIARGVTVTSFVDNTVTAGQQYSYKIKALDHSLNRSGYSNEVTATATGDHDLIAHLTFDGNAQDSTINLNHGASYGGTYVQGKVGLGAISLNGSSDFVQLPEEIANHQEISIVTWVNWAGYAVGQHLFEFNSGKDEYLYLSPSIGGQMQLSIKHDGAERSITASALPAGQWVQVAVTLGANDARIYVNGEMVAESPDITVKPSDLNLVMNYIGVNQSTKKLFEGIIDDFRVYNYEMTGDEVTQLYEELSTDVLDIGFNPDNEYSVWPVPANNVLHITSSLQADSSLTTFALFNITGRMVMSRNIKSTDTKIDVSNLPAGIYMLKLTNSEGSWGKKIIINRY